MSEQFGSSKRDTHDAIFRHPTVRSLFWRDVRSMLRSPAQAARKPNGNLKVTRNK